MHGLESWGNVFNIKKPVIKDWKNLDIKDYIHRCEFDVKINTTLFIQQMKYLHKIYKDNDKIHQAINYLNFKLDCILEQELHGISLDKYKATFYIEELKISYQEKIMILTDVMPKDLGKVLKKKPKTLYKKDGTLSVRGTAWIKELQKRDLPDDTEEIREDPNPGSHSQLKEWLTRLGWEPVTFKVSKATNKSVPQISLPFGSGICPSVKELYKVEPSLEELDSLFKIKHRIGVFQGYFDEVKNGRVYATAHGFTNTLRLKHSKPIVNLPKPGVFYGKEIRECLYNPHEDRIMFGSDVSSLEDGTKQHYIYFFDPNYVKEMRVPGFDPHIDIGILAGLISKEESEFYKWADDQESLSAEDKLKFNKIKKARSVAKTANFAATYGAGGPKIAETAKIPVEEGYKLHQIYWERNKAVKQTADSVKTVTVTHHYPIKRKKEVVNEETGEIVETYDYRNIPKVQSWLYNPVSGFYYYLKEEKDKFSTLNQGTGVFVFDTWVSFVRKGFEKYNIPIQLQYHDEILFTAPAEHKEYCTKVLKDSIKEANKVLNLNINIDISVDYGNNYAECH